MDKRIKAFQKRRDERLKARGLVLYKNRYRADADGDEENNNQESGGSHGNTRLPFGLCKRFGIAVEPGWTPRDAWDALAGKGITPDGAYGRLKEGKDPGATGGETEGAPEKPKAPAKKSLKVKKYDYDKRAEVEKEYEITKGEHEAAHMLDGKRAWRLVGKTEDGEEETLMGFGSKTEMLRYLKEQGITEFPDPETGEILDPSTMELPPEGKKTATYKDGAEYEKLRGSYRSWASRGTNPYFLMGNYVAGTGDTSRWHSSLRKGFMTKEDMMYWLRDHGVEEFLDPESGETVNPQELELPEKIMTLDDGRGLISVSIGLRGGKYVVIGEQLDGKKATLAKDIDSLARAQQWIELRGGSMDKVKLSPALKKREIERVSWLKSDKKEYFEHEGVKYGDISMEKDDWGDWRVTGEAEDGAKYTKEFGTKMDALKFLKEQGVEKVREGKERSNPMDVEIPDTVATIGKKSYQQISMHVDRYGNLILFGTDLDGNRERLRQKYSRDTTQAWIDTVKSDYGLSDDQITIDDEDRAKIDSMKKEDEEKERRRKEWESRAIDFGYSKFADPKIMRDSDGDYWVGGYDRDGDFERISSWGDLYDMDEFAKEHKLDINSLLQDDDRKKEYTEYKKAREVFDAEAKELDGGKYASIDIRWEPGIGFEVHGRDARGRERTPISATSYSELTKKLESDGYKPDDFPMDEESKKKQRRAVKAKELIDSGGWFSVGEEDEAYTDLRVERDSGSSLWKVIGKDMDGDEKVIFDTTSWDGAVSHMGDSGVTKYRVKDGDKELGMPKYGMSHVTLMRKPGGGFVVYADSKRYGKHAVMYEDPKEENARRWLEENNIPAGSIKTRGMNPNDDVPRTHTAKSLEKFDTVRMERAENTPMIADMPEDTKKEVAEMLTDMFKTGAYRMQRSDPDHFESYVMDGFKNLLETGTSSGSSYKPGRRETGEKVFGHKGIPAKDAERYGFWGLEDDLESQNDTVASGYGTMSFKFKKDRVGERTTYTFGDTLDAGRPIAGYAGASPTIEGVSALAPRWGADGSENEKLRKILRDYRKYKAGDMSAHDFYKNVSSRCRDGYVECQFHGPLGIEDVESITMPKRTLDRAFGAMSDESRKKVLTKLQSCGILFRYQNGDKLEDAYDYLKKTYGGW